MPEANGIEIVDLTDDAASGARLWMSEYSRPEHLAPGEANRLRTECTTLRDALRSDLENRALWIELGVKCLALGAFPEAETAFIRALAVDPAFETFEQIDMAVRRAASEHAPFNLPVETRRTLAYLGITYERSEEFRLGEDYVLNALYDCQEPEILMIGGRFYLECSEPEVDTAIAYFKMAVEIDPTLIPACDAIVERFIATRRDLYPDSSWALIEVYLQIWRETIRRLQD